MNDKDLPAFSLPKGNENIYPEVAGMTLRDYFAAKVMPALIVDPERSDLSREECARLSYKMADAMLEARKK